VVSKVSRAVKYSFPGSGLAARLAKALLTYNSIWLTPPRAKAWHMTDTSPETSLPSGGPPAQALMACSITTELAASWQPARTIAETRRTPHSTVKMRRLLSILSSSFHVLEGSLRSTSGKYD
jgi:hypothetical protein